MRAAIAVADDGIALDVSDQALVQMDDAPAAPTASTLYTSLWQENKVGIRVERYLNWKAATGRRAVHGDVDLMRPEVLTTVPVTTRPDGEESQRAESDAHPEKSGRHACGRMAVGRDRELLGA